MTREVFRGHIPDGLRYDIEHDMWVLRDGDHVVIGCTSFGAFRVGEIVAFTAKPIGATVARGRGLGTIESAKTVQALHAPVSFVLGAANVAAEEQPALIGTDPYGGGWLVCGRLLAWGAEADELVDAATYRRHVLRQEPGALIEDAA